MNTSSRIYVAGHRGLVGSAIIRNLESKGYTNLICKTHAELDLTNQRAVETFFETEQPEYVILAAAKVGGIVANNVYRAEFIYENLAIQSNVIHQSYLHGVRKLLFLGSTCIYPKNALQPMTEDSLLQAPLEYTNEPYAIAKIAGIKMCESYNLQYGTNFISVMPTNLYGPNDNFDLEKSHVLPALIRKTHLAKLLQEERHNEVLRDLNRRSHLFDTIENARQFLSDKFGVSGTKVEVWGTGNPRREFMYSEDMADACVFLMEETEFSDLAEISNGGSSGSSGREIRNTHINIGTGIDISIRELAELVREVVGFKGELEFNADAPDGTMVKLTDPSKLHKLGWRHQTRLREGVRKVYEWYQKNDP